MSRTKLYGDYLYLTAAFWLWMESLEFFLSVISTYFFFGWQGVPYLIVWLLGIGFFAMSGPICYKLIGLERRAELWPRLFLGLGLALYLLLAFWRQSDLFAWGIVLATCLSSIALTAALRQISHHHHGHTAAFAIAAGGALFAGIRIFNWGLAPLFHHTHILPLIFFTAFVATAIFWPRQSSPLASSCSSDNDHTADDPEAAKPEITDEPTASPEVAKPEITDDSTSELVGQRSGDQAKSEAEVSAQGGGAKPTGDSFKAGWIFHLQGIAFCMLAGLSMGLIFNLPMWAAQISQMPVTVYLFSVMQGIPLGILAAVFTRGCRYLKLLLVVISGVILIWVLYQLFISPPTNQLISLAAHVAACFALAALLTLLLRHNLSQSLPRSRSWPLFGMQIGFILLLAILTLYLRYADPIGFWVALALVLVFATIDCLVFSQPLASAPRPRILTNINGFYFASLAFALIVGVFGSISVESPRLPLSSKHISVISTNIQYGWTNDYRFEPHRHVQWLTQYKANLIGVQEVNRGHTSGAGIDLFQYYRFMLPGYWMYGDANFGFGNAIYSQFPVLEYKLLRYKASDMLRRSCLRALVNIRGVPVEFWVTHLSHLDPPNPVRQAQIAELREWLKSSKYPWILTGDLNAEPNSPEIQSLLPIVAPIFQKYPDLLKEHTYSSLKPQRRIDYIFWSHHFESHQLRILDNKGNSDHKPVFATLELIDKDATTDK